MKYMLTLLTICSLITAQAEEGIKELYISNVKLLTDSADASIAPDQSKYTFHFPTIDGSTNRMIYSMDGVEHKVKLNNSSFNVITTPGNHIFQFFYSENYYEVYSDSLNIKPRHHSTYQVNMMSSRGTIITADKPVIYLYPEKKMDVSVELEIQGESTFTYPTYNNGWEFEAAPSGELTFGENTYNYLFWEAKIERSFTPDELKSGFNVRGKEVTAFLEEKLTQVGLNSKEQADFITYWGPRLAANDLNFVHFEFNEECNRYAALHISPKPTNVYRIYMLWTAIDEAVDTEAQDIKTFARKGFSVLEWGGSEISISQDLLISEN